MVTDGSRCTAANAIRITTQPRRMVRLRFVRGVRVVRLRRTADGRMVATLVVAALENDLRIGPAGRRLSTNADPQPVGRRHAMNMASS